MREFLEFVIRQLIEFPDDMVLTEIPSGRTTVFKLQLRRGDVGRVIGRGGQTEDEAIGPKAQADK